MSKWIFIVSWITMLLSSNVGYALSFQGVLGINAEFGGGRLLTLTYSDGSTSNILSGQGVSLFGGAVARDLLELGPVRFDLQGTVGVKYSTIREATNANADFYRFPLELLAFFRWMRLRLGVGPSYHFANSFSGSGVLSAYEFSFNNALGVTAQIDYLFGDHFGFGARYTSISYQPQVKEGILTSGSNFGAALSYFF